MCAVLVGDAPGDLASVFGVLLAEEVGGLAGAEVRLEQRSAQHQRALVQEIVAARQQVGLGGGPEPQGAPVVHYQLQAAVRAGGAGAFAENALNADGVLPLVGRGTPAGVRERLIAEVILQPGEGSAAAILDKPPLALPVNLSEALAQDRRDRL